MKILSVFCSFLRETMAAGSGTVEEKKATRDL